MTTTDPKALTAKQMGEALRAGARLSGRLSKGAAVHLLTYTELPGRAKFARHVELVEEPGQDGSTVLAAYVKDWPALVEDESIYLTGGDERLLVLAASYAIGRPVDLSASANGLGAAYAKRVIEAVVIGLGMDGYYTLHDGPRHEEDRRARAALLGE